MDRHGCDATLDLLQRADVVDAASHRCSEHEGEHGIVVKGHSPNDAIDTDADREPYVGLIDYGENEQSAEEHPNDGSVPEKVTKTLRMRT